MAYSKAKLKEQWQQSISLFQTIPHKKHVRQILAYPDSGVIKYDADDCKSFPLWLLLC